MYIYTTLVYIPFLFFLYSDKDVVAVTVPVYQTYRFRAVIEAYLLFHRFCSLRHYRLKQTCIALFYVLVLPYNFTFVFRLLPCISNYHPSINYHPLP